MKTVFVVLIDSMEDASRVATFAAHLAAPAHAELVLLHVDSLPMVEPSYGMVLGTPEYLTLLPDLTEPLTQLAHQLPVPTTVESCQGALVGVLQQALARYQPQLLVLGLKEERAWLDRLLLNQALPVLRNSRLPLLLVPNAVTKAPNVPLKVLLSVDLEPIHLTKPSMALKQVLDSWGAKFTVVHVSEPEAATESNMHQALTAARTSGLVALDAGHGYHMQDPSCSAGVLRAAAATHADLLMMIARPRSFLGALFHHSITAEVTRHSTVPMLLLPVEEEPVPLVKPKLHEEKQQKH